MKDPNLISIGTNIFEKTDSVIKIWQNTFGNNFQELWDPGTQFLEMGDNNPIMAKSWDILNYIGVEHFQKILFSAKEILNKDRPIEGQNSNIGHLTLFIKEPVSDRLLLITSTCEHLHPKGKDLHDFIDDVTENFDGEYIYYTLSDRISNPKSRKSLSSRKKRGLTGWVGVTGIRLFINNEKDKQTLESIANDSTAREACSKFGSPLWGSRISEFPIRIGSQPRIKRLIAVPIYLNNQIKIPIGVLRYSCEKDDSNPLLDIDLHYMDSISSIVASLINVGRVGVISERLNRKRYFFDKLLSNNEFKSDLMPHLRFCARAMRSKITSIYMPVKVNGKEVLRLIDAYGIADKVSNLRTVIKDYSNSEAGLTWKIFNSKRESITNEVSAAGDGSWAGRNTQHFYFKYLRERQISDKDTIHTYRINLIGINLWYEDEIECTNLGVLKVEFPSTIEGNHAYNHYDESFIKFCGKYFASRLKGLRDFIEVNWDMNTVDFENFILPNWNLLSMTKLLNEEECPELLSKLRLFPQEKLNKLKGLKRNEPMRFSQISVFIEFGNEKNGKKYVELAGVKSKSTEIIDLLGDMVKNKDPNTDHPNCATYEISAGNPSRAKKKLKEWIKKYPDMNASYNEINGDPHLIFKVAWDTNFSV